MHLVWHRAELRTHDHPGLAAAARSGAVVVPVVVLDPNIFGRPTSTARRRAWFLENVRALRESYRRRGADLVVREGVPHEVLESLARSLPISDAHFIRNHTPYASERDAAATAALERAGVRVHPHDGQHAHPPGVVLTATGGRYGVFGPYGRKWQSLPPPELAPTPERLPPLPGSIERGAIPRVASDIPLPPAGEQAAIERLDAFLRDRQGAYATTRDRPADPEGTSRLAMVLNIGVLSPRLAAARASDPKWRNELAWRDFHADLLDRQPEGATEEFRPAWRGFPWRRGEEAAADLAAWSEGRTGVPIVDAGMRELRATGFQPNRVRMIAASFLCKHLLIDWRAGEALFRSLLLCGDTAQNVGNWQWVAGSGCDAAPYFRVLNPGAQGERFDPQGEYVRRWVPEVAGLPGAVVHRPWEAACPPRGYPGPLVDLAVGRDRFLATARQFLRGGG